MGVLADLDDTEEAIAVNAQPPVNLCINLEGHRATSLLQLLELTFQGLVLLWRVRLIDPSVKNCPLSSRHRTLEVPVANDVSLGVSVSQRVVRWDQASLHA